MKILSYTPFKQRMLEWLRQGMLATRCYFHKERCFGIIRATILVAVLAGFAILYRFADYSQDELPIDNTWDSAFYILEAFIFMAVFVFISLLDNSNPYWQMVWGLLSVFFSIRLFLEIYVAFFKLDINANIITAILFCAVIMLILWVLFVLPRRKPKDNQN
jgi:hypothetical protein